MVSETSKATIAVGNGTGSLFVHGTYESIKAVEAIINQNRRLREQIDELEESIESVKKRVSEYKFKTILLLNALETLTQLTQQLRS